MALCPLGNLCGGEKQNLWPGRILLILKPRQVSGVVSLSGYYGEGRRHGGTMGALGRVRWNWDPMEHLEDVAACFLNIHLILLSVSSTSRWARPAWDSALCSWHPRSPRDCLPTPCVLGEESLGLCCWWTPKKCFSFILVVRDAVVNCKRVLMACH